MQKVHPTNNSLLRKKRSKNSGLTLHGAAAELLTPFLSLAIPFLCVLSYVRASKCFVTQRVYQYGTNNTRYERKQENPANI